jgi:hypothetical protein
MNYPVERNDFSLHEDYEQALIDRDLASPQFVSWQARKEVKHLLDVVKTLYPDDRAMLCVADVAYRSVCLLDDEIEARAT